MPQLQRARRYLCYAIRIGDGTVIRNRPTIDEGIQDRHGAVGNTGIWVDLLEDCRRHVRIISIMMLDMGEKILEISQSRQGLSCDAQ